MRLARRVVAGVVAVAGVLSLPRLRMPVTQVETLWAQRLAVVGAEAVADGARRVCRRASTPSV